MRDYCPSRHEQAKLKPKKVRAVARSKKKHTLLKKLALGLSFLLVLAIFAALIVYLFRQQWLKKRQLNQAVTVLLLDEASEGQKPQALILLRPQEKSVRVYNLADLNQNDWPSSELSPHLLYSYFFNTFVDQVLTYPATLSAGAEASEVQQAELRQFLLAELRGWQGGAAAAWLQQDNLSWQWASPSSADLASALEQASAAPSPNFACPIAIINGSRQAGLASRLAGILAQKGFSIIRRDNALENIDTSYLLVDPDNTACASLQNSWQTLQPAVAVKEDQTKTQEYRAGAVLFLGQDLSSLNVTLF